MDNNSVLKILRAHRLSENEIEDDNKPDSDDEKMPKKKLSTVVRANLKYKTTKRKQIFGKENILLIFNHYSPDQIQKKGFEIFKNPERTISDNEYVIELLYNLNPFSRRIKEVEKEHSRDLISKLSFAMKYKYYPKNNLIYRYEEQAEYFYVILQGKVDLLVPNEETLRLTENEYFLYLINLRKYNEFILLTKTINKNMESFPMNEKNFDTWIRRAYVTAKEINNTRRLLEQQEKEQKERELNFINANANMPKRFSIINIEDSNNNNTKIRRGSILNSPKKLRSKKINYGDYLPFENEEEIRLSLDLQNEVENAIIVMNKPPLINKEIANNISSEEYINRIKPIYQKDNNNILNLKRKSVVISNYFLAESIKEGEQFGEMMTDQSFTNDDNKRMETVISNHDTHLALLNKNLYNDILRNVVEKSRKHALDFLLNLDIFKYGNKSIFMKNFSSFFKRRNLYYKDILYKENGIIDNNHVIYFVKNGEFGTKAKKSLQEIDNIILKSSLKRNIDKNEIDRLEIYKEYSIKRDIKFESFGENDILGLGDCGVGNRYIYTLFCNSNEATVFEIHITFFKMLLNLDKKILIKAEEIEKIKCDIILRLLYRQRESWLNFIKSKLKYNNLINSNGSKTERLRYTKKDCIMKLKNESEEPKRRKNKRKKTIRVLPILSENNIFERKVDYSSSISINKPLDDNFAIDLLMRDQTTQTNFHNNKTNSNFYTINTNLNDSINSKEKNSFHNTFFENMMIKKIDDDNKRTFKLDLKNRRNKYYYNDNDNKCYILNQKFFNPLIYDDFERRYNTIKYFEPSNTINEVNSYKIHFNSNNTTKTKKKINIKELNFSDSKSKNNKKIIKNNKFNNSIDFAIISNFSSTGHKEFNEKLKNIYYNNKRFKKLYKILNDNKKKVH